MQGFLVKTALYNIADLCSSPVLSFFSKYILVLT